jgi:TonB-dependent Receptor Plug Domain/Carboxypeptidase regulatory-like domain
MSGILGGNDDDCTEFRHAEFINNSRLSCGTQSALRSTMMVRSAVFATLFVSVLWWDGAKAQAQPTPAPPLSATATSPATVATTGRVVDAANQKPIAGATVTIDGTAITTTTAADGSFTIAAPIGVTLVVESKNHEISLVQVSAADLSEIALLRVGAGGAEIIEIAGEAPIAAPGSTTISREEISSVPGSGNDLLASIDILPGVTSNPFGGPTAFNGVVIRGSAPEDSKILIDGFEVPFLYHTVGFRSILPTESVDTLEYLPGGFDVSYGRASSGIIAVTTRGGDATFGGQGELSVIDGGVLAHGSVGKEGRYLVALRRSTIDLVLPSLIPDDADINLTTVPRYWDLQTRYDVALGSRWQLALTSIGSDDSLELFADDEMDPDQRFFSRTRFLRGIADVRWRSGNWSASSAVSSMVSEVAFEAGRQQNFNLFQLQNDLRTELVHTKARSLGLRDVVTRVGAEANIGRADLSLAVGEVPDEGQPMDPNGDLDDIRQRFDGVVWVPNVGTWASVAASLGAARFTTGVRVDRFGRIRQVAVQPRAELSVQLPASFKVRLAAGAYRRPPENNDEYLDRTLNPERATQVVLGTEFGPREGLKVQVSAYYTDRSNLLTRIDDGDYKNVGRGTTYGGELLAILRRGDFSAWASYSLSRSTRVDRPNAESRLFDFDQPHDLNLAASWKLGRWQLGARFRYSSGQPYTPVTSSVFDSDSDAYVPLFGDVNSQRVAGHHQADVRIDRSWKVGRVTLSAFLDVQNVYLNASTVGYGYSFDYSERFGFESIPILPSIGLRGEL